MGNLKLIYFGNASDMSSNLLHHLGLIHFSNNTQLRSGLYLSQSIDHKETFRKVVLNIESPLNDSEVYIVYKYLTTNELDKLYSIKEPSKVFIIAHKMINYSFINHQFISTFSVAYVGDKSVFDISNFNHGFYQKFILSSSIVEAEKRTVLKNLFPYFMLEFLIVLLNPFEEFRAMLFKSNIKVFNRIDDLISFITFLFKTIIVNKIVYFLYYRALHFIYYKIIYFLYYRILHFIYYQIFYFVYYKFYRIFLYQFYKIVTFPIYKIYWFLNYQYITRLKKYVKKSK